MNRQGKQHPRILRPAMDGITPGAVPSVDDPEISAFLDLLAEIIAGAPPRPGVHSPASPHEERHASQNDHH